MILLAVAVVAAIVVMEASRLLWHGRIAGNPALIALHAALAALLAYQGAGVLPLAHSLGLDVPGFALFAAPYLLPVLAVCSVLLSWAALDSKRRNEPLGVWLSGLSSYPWGILACASLGLWGLLVAAVAGWASVGVWMSPLRPERWPASKWERRLGWMHPWYRKAPR